MHYRLKTGVLLTLILFFFYPAGLFAKTGDNGFSLTSKEAAFLAAHPVIRVGIMPAWPPLNFIDAQGTPKGIGVDYLNAISERLKGKLQVIPGPFKENMASVKKKELDAMMDITPKPEREAWFNFTAPYAVIPHVLVARKDGPYYGNERDLSGKIVALESGFYNIKYFGKHFPDVKIKEYKNTSRALDAVLRGEADAYAGNRAVAIFIIEKELMSGLEVQGIMDKSPVVLSIGVRKDWPELSSVLDKALFSLTVEEERAIRQRWLGVQTEKAPASSVAPARRFNELGFVLKTILGVISVIILFAVLIWVARGCPKNFSLKGVHFGVSLVFTGLILGICTLVLILLQMENRLSEMGIRRYDSLRLAHELKQSSDDLTRFARTFAATGEFKFEAYYHDVIAIRDGDKAHPKNRPPSYWDHVAAGTMALNENGDIYSIEEKMDELGLSKEEKGKLARAKEDSDELVNLEIIAMNAVKGQFEDGKGGFTRVGEPDFRMALKLLNGRAYHTAKSKVMRSIDDFFILLETRTRNEEGLLQQKTQAVLTTVIALTILTILFAIFAFFLLKRRVITPLYQLKSGATRLKEGDFTRHIDIRSDDEAGDLALAFNAMADSIKERTDKLRSIIDTAIDAIVVASESGIIQEFSPAAEKMFGYEAKEAIGRHIFFIIPRPDKAGEEDYISRLINATEEEASSGIYIDASGVRQDGEVFSVSASLSRARIGRNWQLTGIIREITEQKLIEEARKVSLKMNQMMDTSSEQEILAFGVEACVRLTRSQAGFFHFVSQDQKAVEFQVWSREVQKECRVETDEMHYPIDRAGVWVDCFYKKAAVIHNSYEDLPDKKGLPQGHLPLVRDLAVPVMEGNLVSGILGVGNKKEDYVQYDIDIVSLVSSNLWGICKRKKAARQLKENEERLKLVLKGGNLGYWDVNLSTRKTIVNERWAQMLGRDWSDADDPYEIWKSSLHPDDRERVLEAGRLYLSGRSDVYEVEYRSLTGQGEVRWLVSRGAVVERDRSGAPVRMVGTVLDITEKKAIEEELKQNMEDLKRFMDIAVGREEKMIDLKAEINGLLGQAGKPSRYKIVE